MDSKASTILGICIMLAAMIIWTIPWRFVPAVTGPLVGRYQIAGVPGHCYILDTATGQVWEDFAPPTEGKSDSDFKAVKLK